MLLYYHYEDWEHDLKIRVSYKKLQSSESTNFYHYSSFKHLYLKTVGNILLVWSSFLDPILKAFFYFVHFDII